MSSELIASWLPSLGLVFGGCCSNAITLENLTSNYPSSGSLITFVQFLVISLYGLPANTHWTRLGPRFNQRRVPIGPYLVQVTLFYFVSLLNNWAFKFNVPMSIHIIFRSAGLVVSMVLGWLIAGKRYNFQQVGSVLLVSLGVVLTTLSASPSSTVHIWKDTPSPTQYYRGILTLFSALILAGLLGLTQDYISSKYFGRGKAGPAKTKNPRPTLHQATSSFQVEKQLTQNVPPTPSLQASLARSPLGDEGVQSNGTPHKAEEEDLGKALIKSIIPNIKEPAPWKESLFYLHFLALPLFLFVWSDIVKQLHDINTSPIRSRHSIPLPEFITNLLGANVLPPSSLPMSFKLQISFWDDRLLIWRDFGKEARTMLTVAIPAAYFPLFLNCATQVVCVAGVHRLTSRVSALSVTLVLTLRKAVSLALSVSGFGMPTGEIMGLEGVERKPKAEVDMARLWVGAVLVLLGTVGYSTANSARRPKAKTE